MTKKKTKQEKEKLFESTIVTSIEKLQEDDPEHRAYILFLSGPLQGKLHCLEQGETILGRDDKVDIPVRDSRISRQHFKILNDGRKAVLVDLQSTNGTFINGKQVSQHVLENGDKIQISSSTIIKFAFGDKGERMFHDEFYQMANFDAATGVYNKRFFSERIKEEFSHALRTGAPLSLLMIDIDFFKHVNDTHGHLAGDCILQKVASTLRSMIRGEDVLCRYGGEEFALMLRGIPAQGAAYTAERIRKSIEEMLVPFEGKDLKVTISVGVATLTDKNFQKPMELVARADEFLYLSKQQGRNRVTASTTS